MNLEQFYRENYHIVFGYLYSLCGDWAWAEDLTSETFLKAIIRIDSYDGRGKVSTWLCAIGKNLYLNERKRRKRQVSLSEAEVVEENIMEEKMIEKAQAEAISCLVLELDENKRQVFTMRLEGLNFREIGEAMGKSENWARVNFFRAKNEILERLEGES